MGGIIFWTIIRTAILIPALWFLHGVIEYKHWWWFGVMSVYGIIIHPAAIQYRLFLRENKDIINNSLCASCKHFDKTAVLCMEYDKHPTMQSLPCEGLSWEPVGINYDEKKIDT